MGLSLLRELEKLYEKDLCVCSNNIFSNFSLFFLCYNERFDMRK